MSIRVASAIATGFDVFAQSRGTWRKLFDAGARARFLDFTYIDFSAFSFSGDQTPQTIGGKIKIKKVDKASFSIRNEKLNWQVDQQVAFFLGEHINIDWSLFCTIIQPNRGDLKHLRLTFLLEVCTELAFLLE